MRVLFFVEPFPVRGAPLEYRWVVEQWFRLGRGLAQRGVTPLFAVSDALKGAFPDAGAPLFCPSDFGVDYAAPESQALVDQDWVRLMSDPNEPTWRPFVEQLLERTRPDAVVSWTVNAPLRAATAARSLLLMHQELGLMRAPNPMTYFADPVGLNGASALAQVWPQVREQALTLSQERELEWLSSEALPGSGQARDAIARTLGLAPGRRTLAIFLQVSRDSNVLMWPRVAGNAGLVSLFLNATRGSDFQIVVKPHPGEAELPPVCAAEGVRRLPAGTTTEAILDIADAVCTINSTLQWASRRSRAARLFTPSANRRMRDAAARATWGTAWRSCGARCRVNRSGSTRARSASGAGWFISCLFATWSRRRRCTIRRLFAAGWRGGAG